MVICSNREGRTQESIGAAISLCLTAKRKCQYHLPGTPAETNPGPLMAEDALLANSWRGAPRRRFAWESFVSGECSKWLARLQFLELQQEKPTCRPERNL